MSGSLVCVGIGMKLGAHISPISRSHIEQADVVFSGVSDGIVELWLKEMHPDVRSLQMYYAEGKNRNITYNEMVEAMLAEVRAGKNVVGAFYGHPGVFALAPHKSIQQAKLEGFEAYMEPGISAEDCLVADLGIDPGKFGCQQYEASQFMFYKRRLDPSAYLILWQIGVAGDKTLGKFNSDKNKLALLVGLLANDYPSDHQVILYEAAVLPIDMVRAEHIALADLPNAELHQHTTLVIPPAKPMEKNQQLLEQIRRLDEQAQLAPCSA
ncbi:hypothetical protein K0504_02165 [Neiella marina]|uniref:Tetrapyrrole methylase domain-containing protein n=1 Tax=Neiella holothuriorum TaxID=2870530 RepID=A0ABS7EC08_9GAMM|nr:SAM-dependent methyltransferase [Neiella holothuriorum]MBW8189826.1 hypothetical protein [Neiella holothuriorum]